MRQASKLVTGSTVRQGNVFRTTFTPNVGNAATETAHASFSSGVTLADHMAMDQTSSLAPVAKDISTPSSGAGLSSTDQAHLDEAGGAQPIVSDPTTTEAPAATATNWTPIFLALAVLILAVKL